MSLKATLCGWKQVLPRVWGPQCWDDSTHPGVCTVLWWSTCKCWFYLRETDQPPLSVSPLIRLSWKTLLVNFLVLFYLWRGFSSPLCLAHLDWGQRCQWLNGLVAAVAGCPTCPLFWQLWNSAEVDAVAVCLHLFACHQTVSWLQVCRWWNGFVPFVHRLPGFLDYLCSFGSCPCCPEYPRCCDTSKPLYLRKLPSGSEIGL